MDNKSHLTVYKASAGSGKTFRLAVQYITMLVKQPDCYRDILAVTFTNKATAEMKQRIMSQLYGIGHGLRSSQGYFEEVKKSLPLTEQTIRHNAVIALDSILQDYGHFRVETIDSFFQTVLRGLARELGIGSGLTLELDTEVAINEAVDSFLANVEQGSADKRNVMKFVENNINNDLNWSIDKTIKKFSHELFSEIFMEHGKELRDILSQNPDAVNDYKKNLITFRDSELSSILEQIKDAGREIESTISSAGFGMDILTSHSYNDVQKILSGTIIEKDLSKTFIKCTSQPEEFFRAHIRKKFPQLINLAQEYLCPCFAKVKSLYDEYTCRSNSYNAALKYLHELSLLLGIRNEIDRQSQEQGRFILADTPQLLHQMEEGDTSFVYEKTGSFIKHLMIDEFQDTSDLQWRNLYLLMNECLSIGQDCLVVGDVKQSIYRWRNSDWTILNTGIFKEFARFNPLEVTMESNFRSRQQVIDFNNTLFPKAVEYLSLYYKEVTGLDYPDLTQAYGGVEQKCAHNDGTGYVYADVLTVDIKANELVDIICYRIAEQLDKLTQAGVLPSDIAILCRKTDTIAAIAQWFTLKRPEYNMISGEAFQLDSSITIRIIICALRWLADCSDSIALAQVAWEYERAVNRTEVTFDQLFARGLEQCLPDAFIGHAGSLRNLPLYELTEKLYALFELNKIEGQDQYMMAFQDLLRQWISRNPAHLAEFLTDWDETLHKISIPAPDINGVRLFTIHKSKGLEFHTVIVPFCEWPVINVNNENRIWIEPDTEPFDGMPFIPVQFSTSLGNSAFSRYFKREAGLQTVDNLNLLYVALTRAVSNLIIISHQPLKKGYISVNKVLQVCLSEEPFQTETYKDGIILETGQICPHAQKTDENTGNPFDAKPSAQKLVFHTYPINARFRQSGESVRFVSAVDDDSYRQEEYIQTGLLLHSLFATIRTMDDIDPMVDQMLRDGLLSSASDAGKLKLKIRRHIDATPGALDWFSRKNTLFNESSIIYRDGGVLQTRRPDRVMITPEGRVIIVDFKFGREREEYLHQVREYMDLLHKMGHKEVEGYIWYVYNNKTTSCK